MGSIFRTIVNFLFSKANKEFIIFLLFFALAGIFWLMMTLNESYEREVKILVRYTNAPKNAVMTSAETDTVRLTIRDKGFNVLSYLYDNQKKIVYVDFMKHAKSMGYGTVNNADLVKLIESDLPASSKIVSVKPEQLTFHYNFGEKKRVPVEWRGQVEPEPLYFISSSRCKPDSATVYALKSKLDSIKVVYTENINYSDFHDTLRVNAPLVKTEGVKTVPDKVEIEFITDVLTEESIGGIPVVGINMPEGKVLRTFPAKVSVTFVAGMNTYKSLSPKDFDVVADYEEFQDNPSTKCTIRLTKIPAGISRARVEPAQVDYLIEEKAK